ncbi:MAG: hypothetical protein A2046_00735 [Bacteroidetes bacterium GWA2_30_7]|nr:MAG: hypothetical protein A2046_00735 [Bacteroidetes bacterium GWA2_30_7]
MKILLVSATEIEIKHILKDNILQSFSNHYVDYLITGFGVTAMTYALTKQLKNNHYDLIINAGIAGDLNNKFDIGEIVYVAEDTFGDFGSNMNGEFLTQFEKKWLNENEFPFKNGFLQTNFTLIKQISQLSKVRGITVNTISNNPEILKNRRIKFNADIETMEGAAFMYVCLNENIECIQIRAISNKMIENEIFKLNVENSVSKLNSFIIDFINSL